MPEVSWDKDRGVLRARGHELRGVDIDASLTPDLVPTIAVLGALAKGRTVVFNAEHVRHKETDRLKAMASELVRWVLISRRGPMACNRGWKASRGRCDWVRRS